MKKFFLTLVLSLIGFIGFSSAYSLGGVNSISCNGGSCNTISIPENALGLVVVSNNNTSNCFLQRGSQYFQNTIGSEQLFNGGNSNYIEGFCGVKSGIMTFKYLLPDPSVVQGGTSQLSPVITGLFGVFSEFIPYVVYVSIGILLVTLGFYAVKWLVNWVASKINRYFRS